MAKKSHARTLTWLSYKQLCDKHGAQEANGLINNKAVLVRQHPRCPDFFQFLDEDEMHMVSTEKYKELQVDQNQAIKSKEYKKLLSSLRGTNFDAMDYDACLGGALSEEEGEDGEDGDGEDGYLPKALKDLMGEKKKKKVKDPKGDDNVDDNADALTAAPGDNKHVINGKAQKMMKLLEQVPAGPHADAAKKHLAMLKKQVSYKIVDKAFLVDCAKLYKKCCKA